MEAERLSKEAFSMYGKVLSEKKDGCDADNEQFSFWANVALFEMKGESTAGILEGKKRAIILKRMERHVETAEILFQMSEDSILFVGLSKDSSTEIKEIKSFMLRQGDTILLNPGTWHWVPFPVSADRCITQVMFKKGTSDVDCEIVELPKSVHYV